ncbi:hypothetical protein DFJ74DRAFT_711981 [Hyaloraphidium curvatum]|nr:hypothetical protein DFJ74DRAFT_711981 [Hyaloraphidium curvatum]
MAFNFGSLFEHSLQDAGEETRRLPPGLEPRPQYSLFGPPGLGPLRPTTPSSGPGTPSTPLTASLFAPPGLGPSSLALPFTTERDVAVGHVPESAFDSLFDRLAKNLAQYSSVATPFASSAQTLVGDRGFGTVTSQVLPDDHGDLPAGPTPESFDSAETRAFTEDSDSLARMSPISPTGSSTWAKVATFNVPSSSAGLARFRTIEDEVSSVEDGINISPGKEIESPEHQRAVVRVSDLPRHFAHADIKKMLKAHGVRSSITHFIINRKTFEKVTAEGIRSPLPVEEVYLEFKVASYADALLKSPQPKIGGKPVAIAPSDAPELRAALFPKLKGRDKSDDYPVLPKDEIAAILDFCTRAEAAFPHDNSIPFEHVCSILQKIARMDSDKVPDMQRNAVYDLAKLSINALHLKLSAKRGNYVGLQQGLLVKLVVAALTVPNFTPRQKYNITKESGLAPSHLPTEMQGHFVEPPRPVRYNPATGRPSE